MLSFLTSFISNIVFSFYEPLGACIFSIPLKKRKHHALYGLLTVLLYWFISFLMSYYQITWVIQIPIKFLGLAIITFSINQTNYLDSVYVAVWSNTVHMFIFNIIIAIDFLGAFKVFKVSNFLLISTPIYLIGYILTYFILVKKICYKRTYNVSHKLVLSAILTVLPFMVFNNMIAYGSTTTTEIRIINYYCCIFSCVSSIFVLYIQRTTGLNAQLNHDYNLMQQMLNQRQLQYEISKENIDIINQKCHDLKHQLNMLQNLPSSEAREAYIKEVSESIMFYDSVFRTGNEALDTLLTEKSLFCLRHGITIKCIADGKCLNFMDPIDLYSLLGNAIDNAFESVCNLEDENLRMINLYVHMESSFATITVENYVDECPEIIDGIPQTTKDDTNNHGFGIKSMKYTAKKYGGQMTINVENSMFIVRFLFPIQ